VSRPHSRLVPVLLAVLLLLGAANLGAYAATGGPLLLGKTNTASKTTTLKKTGAGPALALKTKGGAPPLKVNSKARVSKLNADLVDGLNGATLSTKPYVYQLEGSGSTPYLAFPFPGLPSGRYLVDVNITLKVTGGPVDGVGCAFQSIEPSVPFQLVFSASNGGGTTWWVNGGGVLDTTKPQHFICTRTGGTATTVPSSNLYSAQVAFTRVDGTTAGGSIGTTLGRLAR
jgi:hypothetical protein